MKSLAVRLSLVTVVLFCVAFVTPAIAWAQDNKPLPESPPPESKPDPPPSPPAESPRNDPPPSPPAESPRNDPPPSPPAESPRSESPPSRPTEAPRSDPAPSSGGSRNNDGGSSRGNNDNRRNDNDRRPNEDGGGVRGTMSGDGSGNRRDRVIETESGDIVVPGRTRASTPDSASPGGNNSGSGNSAGSAGGGGGNRSGGRDGRDRNRDRDGDRGRWRDRDGDRRGHRHYRGDECYQVPTYDDTVSYSPVQYPDYDRDDSLDAYELGYNDGLYTGANDGRRGQTYDPERSRFHKRPVGYHPNKGNRADYEQAYRDGFLRGYREGYQNWHKYFVGGRFKR